MIIRRTILALLILLTNPVSNAQLIKANEIFVSSQFNNFVISPNGQTFIGKSFLDGDHQLFAFKSTTNQASEIFKLSNSGKMEIIDYDWLDNDTAYVSYIGSFSRIYTRIIDFSFNEEDFDIDYFNVEGIGLVINPMEDQEDKALYARLDVSDKKFELLEVNLNDFRSVKHNKKNHDKIFKQSKNLSDGLDDTFEFYVSNIDYSLEMVGQYFDDYNSYSVYDNNSGTWREFFRVDKNTDDEKNYSKLDVFEPIAKIDDNSIVALSNIGRDKVAVVTFDTHQKKDINILYESESYDVSAATYNREQKRLVSVTYVDRGVKQQKYLDTVSQQLQAQLQSKIGLDSIFVIDRSLDKNDMVIYAYDATHPGKFYHYDAELDKLRFLQNEMPDLHPYEFTKGKLLVTKNELDKLVEAFLFLPVAQSKSPLVVVPHGGPIGVQDRNEFNRATQFLVNRGYAVLTINFRGSAGYGKEYMNAGREQFGQGIESDIHLMTQQALKQPQIDASKVCIYGTSYGGYSAVASTILYPDTYQCAISAFGVFDLPLLYTASNLNLSRKAKDAISFIVGDIDTQYEELKENSPLYKADQIKIPTLIFAGLEDEIAHPEHSRRLNYVLKQLDKTDVDYHEYTRSSHGHNNWFGDIHQYVTIIDFLDTHIGQSKAYSKKDYNVLGADYYSLGMIYYNGHFVEKDKVKAEHFLKQAHYYGDGRAAQYLRRLGVYDF